MLLQDICFLVTQNPEGEVLEEVDLRICDTYITETGEPGPIEKFNLQLKTLIDLFALN